MPALLIRSDLLKSPGRPVEGVVYRYPIKGYSAMAGMSLHASHPMPALLAWDGRTQVGKGGVLYRGTSPIRSSTPT